MTTSDDLRLKIENLDLRRLLLAAGVNATEQKHFAELQRAVLLELHHRVSNTLAIIIAITSQTLLSAEDLEHGRLSLIERLIALGRAHEILLQANWQSTPLSVLVGKAIEPFDATGSSQFVVTAPAIEVSAAAVLPLSMVLNELCTNAVKYGALSTSAGRVEITASVNAATDRFRLTWTERGGPVVSLPTRRSLGSNLIERSFPSQVEGVGELRFDPAGATCVIDIPIASLLTTISH